MNLRFDDDESSSALFVSIVALLGFNVFYFALAIPFSSVLGNPIFLTSYAIWTLLSFLLALRDVKGNKRAKNAFAIFAVLLATSLVLANSRIIPTEIPYSFPGFFTGIALWGLVVLLKRSYHRAR